MNFRRAVWFVFRLFRKLCKLFFGTPVNVRRIGVIGGRDADFQKKVGWYLPDFFEIVQGKADLYLITDWRLIFLNLFRLHKCAVVDENFYSTESCTAWSYLYGAHSGKDFSELSQKNFAAMAEKLKDKEKACCFLTGASFSDYDKHPETLGMIKVICNSVVKNDEFLEWAKPDILCFADPVYHFSWNEYSETFRRDVLKTAEKYGVYIMMPENMVALMLAHYPRISDKIIGVGRNEGLNFPSAEDISVHVTDNILTYLMLPAASALADEIYILGANGRSSGDKMFWKHNSLVQYEGLMQKVVDAHPSFFRDRNYVQYQNGHDEQMEALFAYGEAQGRKYISLNGSYLLSISKRYNGVENVS
ncbi:MAG: hypothetical protein AB7F25_04630 [Deferribacterales bacterium]